MTVPLFRLCLVTDRKSVNNGLLEIISEAVEGGVDAVQIRENDLSAKEIYEMVLQVREVVKDRAKIIVNDRIDAAVSAGADGVHLGWKSIPLDKAVEIAKRFSLFVGISCHSIGEVIEAKQKDADYVSLGPIYETPSKKGILLPLGLEEIKKVKDRVNIHLTAIGGIEESNCDKVIKAGADAVSVIRAIQQADAPYESAKRLKRIIGQCSKY